jgi:hypothetical protein
VDNLAGDLGIPQFPAPIKANNSEAGTSHLNRVAEVQFSDGEGHYVIRPTQQDWELAALKIEVMNTESSVVFLPLNEDALYLRDKDRTEYLPIDFREQREKVPEALSDNGHETS